MGHADAHVGEALALLHHTFDEPLQAYAGRNWTGRAGCIRLGQQGNLAGGLVNNVHSYRWVTPATCNRFPTALDLRPR